MDEIDRELQRLRDEGYVVEPDTEKLLRSVKEVNYQEGYKIGFAQAFAEGFAQGFAEEFKKGFESGKVEVIKPIIEEMLKKGCSIDKIVEMTDVDKDTVENIAEELAS